MRIEQLTSENRTCPCGCGQVFPVFLGRLKYGDEHEFRFKAAHLTHGDSGSHVWLLLGSGPWFENDKRNCWVTMHLYSDNENTITRIEDPEESPFWPSHDEGERYLTRLEVMSQDGGKEWAINRRLDFEDHHEPTAAFLQGK